MGREIHIEDGSLEDRPGVFLIGAPNAGKRTLLSRLLSIDIPETSDLSEGVFCQGWTLETKYYSADISLWVADLTDGFSSGTLAMPKHLAGLVMVFDMTDESSFLALKEWAESIELKKFEVLLCIGNKVDLVSGHSAHVEYRRYLQKRGESSSYPHPEFWDYGIDEAEGCSLLGEEEPSVEIRKTYLDWCLEHNIEYIEACASNADFDKCLSINGDIQGVRRLFDALSAYMWPGMVMKLGETTTVPTLLDKQEEMTDEESDYEIEYEVLSRGSDEPWEYVGVSSNEQPSTSKEAEFVEEHIVISNIEDSSYKIVDADNATPESKDRATVSHSNDVTQETGTKEDTDCANRNSTLDEITSTSKMEIQEDRGANDCENIDLGEGSYYGHEDLEKLMCEIGSMRDSLRLMPDVQRRDMAAKLAMRMAAMFAESSDEEGNFD